MKIEELFEVLMRISKQRKVERRIRLGLRREQSILLDFVFLSECFSHLIFKRQIAERFRKEGKQVFIEKGMILHGIRMRPDVCFFENGKWNIFEIEHNGGHKNNIIRNMHKLSDIASIQIIDVQTTKFCLF